MFEPASDWYTGLPQEPAWERLRSAGLEVSPDLSEEEMISSGWSLLVSDHEQEIAARSRDVPCFTWSAAAILDPSVDPVDEPRFGIVLYAEDPWSEGGRRLEGINVGDIELPVVVRKVRFEAHRASSSSIGPGRVACWSTSRHREREGWLTALHVAQHSAMPGQMVDRGRACIDAALVDIGRPPTGTARRAVPPLDGRRVALDLGTPTPAKVIDVATNLGIGRSSHFPFRFTVNVAGVPGDSGGLIVAVPGGDPVGIYLGSHELASGARSGVGLAINQLEYLMNLEAYL